MMKLIIKGLGIFWLVLAVCAGPALATCDALSGGKEGRVARVLDGATLELASGKIVRLIGVLAPLRPLALAGDAAWRWDSLAQEALAELTLGKLVRVAYGGRKRDRHGRLLAHLFVVDGDEEVWVQGQLLGDGLVRATSFADNKACMAALYQAEGIARAAGRGIWQSETFEVLPPVPELLLPLVGTFQLVEGQVLAAEQVRERLYLNFGKRWSTDFTVIIYERALKSFADVNISPLSYEKKRIRVRGWLFEDGGPVIEVNHREQIEAIVGDLGE